MRHLSRLAVVGFIAAGLSACDKGHDPADQVKDALKAEQIEDVKVDYDRDSKAIHLTGSVDSPSVKQRAEQVAAKAVGTSGNVLNELTIEGTAENRADDLDGTIRKGLNALVDQDQTLNKRDVNFDVNNGAVEIKGSVASATEKTRVGEMVRGVQGVKDIANGLEVHPDKYSNRKEPVPAPGR
jgi:osmotically-inducible protein OsmY